MESLNSEDGPLSELQLTTHEPLGDESDADGLSCVVCKQQIEHTYFALGDQVICSDCRDAVMALPKGSGLVRFFKAAFVGTLAGLLGALIWYLIRVIADLEIGLVAILVGLMVGKAVYWGSSNRGGIKYQVLAVLITYGCISANYMPDILQALMNEAAQRPNDPETDTPPNTTASSDEESGGSDLDASAVAKEDGSDGSQKEPELRERRALPVIVSLILLALFTFVLALATPVLMGIESPIGLLIVGFALWEAWKFSAHRSIPITGPYETGDQGGFIEAPI